MTRAWPRFSLNCMEYTWDDEKGSGMAKRVAFYQLSHKFVDSKDAPAEAKNLIYYSLAIGHHVGVLDCFSSVMTIEEGDFEQWIAKLPEGEGRRKLEGVLKWGEIEINQDHIAPLASAMQAGLPEMQPQEQQWANSLLQLLRNMAEEPVLYLMVRSYEGPGLNRR